jgi:hypothetical protein
MAGSPPEANHHTNITAHGKTGADVGAEALPAGLVGVPVDEPAMVPRDEYLPFVLRELAPPG